VRPGTKRVGCARNLISEAGPRFAEAALLRKATRAELLAYVKSAAARRNSMPLASPVGKRLWHLPALRTTRHPDVSLVLLPQVVACGVARVLSGMTHHKRSVDGWP